MKTKTEKAPILILNASRQPYLSVGTHFGGIKAFGYKYIYLPMEDVLLRRDYFGKYNKHKKNGRDFKSFIDSVKSV